MFLRSVMAEAWQYIYSGQLLILFLLAQMAPIFFEVWMEVWVRTLTPSTENEVDELTGWTWPSDREAGIVTSTVRLVKQVLTLSPIMFIFQAKARSGLGWTGDRPAQTGKPIMRMLCLPIAFELSRFASIFLLRGTLSRPGRKTCKNTNMSDVYRFYREDASGTGRKLEDLCKQKGLMLHTALGYLPIIWWR